MARHPAAQIHALTPDDISVTLIRDQQLSIGIADGYGSAGNIWVHGDTDRERLGNLLAVAARLCTAALDLMAEVTAGHAQTMHSDGRPAPSCIDAPADVIRFDPERVRA